MTTREYNDLIETALTDEIAACEDHDDEEWSEIQTIKYEEALERFQAEKAKA